MAPTGPASTTAGQALAAGHGVSQDYAHLMLALCRLLGIPARYVSGHLGGEGGTHAWVEVLQPVSDPAVEIVAWDPTHDRPADLRYLTVAVGRGYRDVAPVSGTYCGPHAVRLPASASSATSQATTVLNWSIPDEVSAVDEHDAFAAARRPAREQGSSRLGSSGAALYAAQMIAAHA